MAKGRLLVLEWDGLRLRGAVASLSRSGALSVAALAESGEIDPADALRTVLAALRSRGNVPSRCLLITGEATAALVRLPLPRGKARVPQQMAQLVRWELEPYFAQRSAAHQIGSILVGRGHLAREEVGRVVAAMRERRGRDGAAARFGAVARDLGCVTEDQLREALSIQSRLVHEVEDYACGWSAQRGEDQSGSLWLGAGMPRERRRFWADALASHECRLAGIYPLTGVSAAALDNGAESGRAVLEVDWDLAACAALRNGGVESLQVLPLGEDEEIEGVCAEMLETAGAGQVFLGGGAAGLRAVADSLGGRVRVLEPVVEGALPEDVPASSLGRIAGVLRHVAGRAPGAAAVRIPVRDARPPVRTRPVFWWAAAAVVLAVAVLSGELLLAGAVTRARARLDDVRNPLARVEGAITVERGKAAEATRLREARDAAAARSAILSRSLDCFEQDLKRRSAFLPLLLDALANSVGDDLIVDRLAEGSPGEVRVEGWALSERAVQLFARTLQGHLADQALLLRDQEIRSERSSQRSDLYAFSFRLVPAPEEGS